MPSWLRELAAIGAMAVATSVGLVVVGAIIAAAHTGHYRTTIASMLFIGGAAVVLWNAVAGGGLRGRRRDMQWRGAQSVVAPVDSLAWVGVGVLVIAGGLLPAFVL